MQEAEPSKCSHPAESKYHKETKACVSYKIQRIREWLGLGWGLHNNLYSWYVNIGQLARQSPASKATKYFCNLAQVIIIMLRIREDLVQISASIYKISTSRGFLRFLAGSAALVS